MALAGQGVAPDRVLVEGDLRSAGRYMVARAGRLGPGTLRLDSAAVRSLGEQVLPLEYLRIGRSYGSAPTLGFRSPGA
jgi:hypothetical protein